MNESNLFDRLDSMNKAPEQTGEETVQTKKESRPERPRKPNPGPGFDYLTVFRILIAAILLILPFLIHISDSTRTLILLASSLTAGYDILIAAARNLLKLRFFSMQILLTLSAAAVFLIGEPFDAAAALILYRLSLLLQDYASTRTRQSVRELMKLQSSPATVLRDGGEKAVSADDVEVGEVISIKPGERVPVNCEVLEGESRVDASAVTGNNLPSIKGENDTLLAGSVNLSSVLQARVTARAADSTAALIREAVEGSGMEKKPNGRPARAPCPLLSPRRHPSGLCRSGTADPCL